MATEVVKVVDVDNGAGTDYTSLSNWEANEQGDLTGVRDEIAIAKCRCTGGTADTNSVDILGWTTSTTQYIKIWTDPEESYRHAGIFDASKYVLKVVAANSNPLILAVSNVKIIGLQIALDHADSSYQSAVNLNASDLTGVYIEKNIIVILQSTSGCKGINVTGDGQTIYAINNIIYDWTSRAIYLDDATSILYLYNNTI